MVDVYQVTLWVMLFATVWLSGVLWLVASQALGDAMRGRGSYVVAGCWIAVTCAFSVSAAVFIKHRMAAEGLL